ncbi:hypothetical protein QVD17_04540 [Tagetes erecta]|uniref:PH domain-containing protein n=1 Tax=Tagetes erecta TaxID=13708 RepID=A0AAD8LJR4_TARER|nr:hypothetical protein QVD17_04540 [Tagetes erecta]
MKTMKNNHCPDFGCCDLFTTLPSYISINAHLKYPNDLISAYHQQSPPPSLYDKLIVFLLELNMRVKELVHPLCCTSVETSSDDNGVASCGSESCFAGALYKWTNYAKGWRSRCFLLRNGVISYSNILQLLAIGQHVTFIGDVKRLHHSATTTTNNHHHKPGAIVHLKVLSFRESRSDESRLYVFTATKTLHLRTSAKKERVAWIEALASTKNLLPLRQLDDKPSIAVPTDISFLTERLKNRLLEEGNSEVLVKDCEQIILLEFSEIQKQIKVLCEERSNLLKYVRDLEAANIEVKAYRVPEGEYQLTQEEVLVPDCGKYSEWCTFKYPDDVEKLKLEMGSEDEEIYFFDTQDCFPELKTQPDEMAVCEIERRKKLPDPAEKEKGVSLWSLIKDNVGKDLTRVCLPVYFNEPISSLQKCFEDLEYSYLLDQAYHHGKEGNSLQRILNVAAFAVSAYSSSVGRYCKPFNPLLGETYEADYPEKGVRFFSEKVSHHPTLIACHCEGKGWKFWGDSNIRTKFWGRSIQLDPVGVLTLEFDDGEVFKWSKVTTSIHNLIFGKIYCDHHGMMHIRGNREYSCQLKFKEQSFLEKIPRQVQGFVEDVSHKKHATLFGKWDDSIYYINGVANVKPKNMSDANLLWRRSMPPTNPTRYNLTSFAITLNELTPGLQEKLPPTDSRLRPDQRHLENGEYDMANTEKLRLETRQRMSRKIQENGWKPRV